ncbi:hypothetical protein Salat_1859800 [Sesamum alatum]|uniref:Uncharacterized protein n=1 Tax=Sesamum alatum TaxID=300844 RepID=A0AAE1Y489_9LAMI|nr:hypothetical protein Salat_1859800 [Sesamum alatum]
MLIGVGETYAQYSHLQIIAVFVPSAIRRVLPQLLSLANLRSANLCIKGCQGRIFEVQSDDRSHSLHPGPRLPTPTPCNVLLDPKRQVTQRNQGGSPYTVPVRRGEGSCRQSFNVCRIGTVLCTTIKFPCHIVPSSVCCRLPIPADHEKVTRIDSGQRCAIIPPHPQLAITLRICLYHAHEVLRWPM